MAVARDNSAFYTGSFGLGGTVTKSYTVGTITNGMLIVTCGVNSAVTDPATSATYNGVAMTKIAHVSRGAEAMSIDVFALAAPATGTNNLVITFAASYVTYDIIVVSYSGALQATPTNVVTQSGVTGVSSFTSPITTGVNNSWAWQVCVDQFGGAVTYTTGHLVQQDTGGTYSHNVADSNGAITPAGTYTFAVTANPSDTWAAVAVEVPPAGTSAPNSNFFLLM